MKSNLMWYISKQYMSTHNPGSSGHPLHMQTEYNTFSTCDEAPGTCVARDTAAVASRSESMTCRAAINVYG